MEHCRILLVEDDTIVALDSRRRLERLGYDVVAVASDGGAALTAVRARAPDVVLMDIGLPGAMDGIETAAKIAEITGVPIVYVTAYEDAATLARVKVSEPHGYVLKPFRDREIQITIELAVYRHAMERERARLQAQIKRLEGIIPICSHCKKMRNDAGYWRQVESYLSERTDAQFSQSICPDCMPVVYPPEEYPYLYDENAQDEPQEAK